MLACFLETKINDKNIQNIVASIMDNPSCGHVFRIKGFFKTENGAWMELNATRTHLHISPIDQGQEVMIVIGEGLEKQAIENFFR